MSSSSRCAYSVILKYHWLSCRLVTTGAAALAQPRDDLLVGQHGLVLRAPVDVAGLAVGQAALVETQEQPLGPVVVLRDRRCAAAVTSRTQPVPPERVRLGLDVGVGPVGRVGAADGGVLRGQAERVPADRVQHVVAAQPQVAGDDVTHHERLGVAHVQVA